MKKQINEIERELKQLNEHVALWKNGARRQGLLPENSTDPLLLDLSKQAGNLFETVERRPLVVGLFGGTGVGKSTLMNRFAGEQIARTGVERPTSREVTIYLHRAYELKQLPSEFPIEKVNIRQHARDERQDVMWIDMPDIDSVEVENLAMVKAWLPFVDVVIYVVSPDRYRDARGWEYLRDQGFQHAWLFVINQWDQVRKDEADQADQARADSVTQDFDQILTRAGFSHAQVFRTDCVSQREDEFLALENTLDELSGDHTLVEIEKRGLGVRVQQLIQNIDAQLNTIGTPSALTRLKQEYDEDWQQMTTNVVGHLTLNFQRVAGQFIQPRRSIKSMIFGGKEYTPDQTQNALSEPQQTLWDQRASAALDDTLTKVIQQADQLNLPKAVFQTHLRTSLKGVTERMPTLLQQHLQNALAKPGNAWQRFIYRASGLLATLLPLAALIWIAWRVISVYYAAETDQYFGFDFVWHSGMLLLLAWGIPSFIRLKLQPSAEQAALYGLQTGLDEGLAEVRAAVDAKLREVEQLIENFTETGEQLKEACQILLPQTLSEKHPQLDSLWQAKNQTKADQE